MDHETTPTTTYVASVVECSPAAWQSFPLPSDIRVPEGRLTLSPLRPVSGGVGFPNQAGWATLRLGRPRTPVGVVVEMTRWDERSVELGIRPPRRRPFWVSSDRYLRTARAALDRLARILADHADHADHAARPPAGRERVATPA
jgi:hypothetical protein